MKLWWKREKDCLEKDLKPFSNDEDATMLALFVEKNNCDVEMYTEPRLSMSEKTYMKRLIEKQKGHESVEENESPEDSESSLLSELSLVQNQKCLSLLSELALVQDKNCLSLLSNLCKLIPTRKKAKHLRTSQVKIMIPPRKKAKHVEISKRNNDRLGTLKTRDIVGPKKHAEDPFVIPEEDISVGSARGRRLGMTSKRV
ncbi:hypothetical protein KIW84_031561 [Lathyrus oleraceus]|uniref:Uncharacterized protein n=1 Tax=Pisum sativum TaxID=3888 RepID=A0A9D4XVM6_PEA|nr:hypothetical protein KIW84_031561 [Pisum sativum]